MGTCDAFNRSHSHTSTLNLGLKRLLLECDYHDVKESSSSFYQALKDTETVREQSNMQLRVLKFSFRKPTGNQIVSKCKNSKSVVACGTVIEASTHRNVDESNTDMGTCGFMFVCGIYFLLVTVLRV